MKVITRATPGTWTAFIVNAIGSINQSFGQTEDEALASLQCRLEQATALVKERREELATPTQEPSA